MTTIINIRIKPKARQNKVIDFVKKDNQVCLTVSIAQPPVDNAANDELVRFMAKLLGLRMNQVEIIKGLKSKNKVLRIQSDRAFCAQDFMKSK